MSSHKTFTIKQFLAKKQKQNQSIPQWSRMRTSNKIRYNSKRRHWSRTKLGLQREAAPILMTRSASRPQMALCYPSATDVFAKADSRCSDQLMADEGNFTLQWTCFPQGWLKRPSLDIFNTDSCHQQDPTVFPEEDLHTSG
uniref:Uncharacterized protein n=1 Tax=Sphaerodactylus townsendi TaxID=933632 RepID=A0ACB8FN28_9SAUR